MARDRSVINTTIDPDLWEWLDAYHWRTRTTKSRVLEEALRDYRAKHDPNSAPAKEARTDDD